jgi:hypothetical protein
MIRQLKWTIKRLCINTKWLIGIMNLIPKFRGFKIFKNLDKDILVINSNTQKGEMTKMTVL